MKNNVIISSVVASLLVVGMVGVLASADDIKTGNIEKVFKKSGFEIGLGNFSKSRGELKKGKGGIMYGLTDEEKTSIESMNYEEKKVFFETKKEEKKIERQAHENVIDKLLAGENLSSEEETIRSEIIKFRAERKNKMEERKVEREELKSIIKKKKAGEDLTDQEQAKLDEMKSNYKKGGKRGNKRGKRDHR